jgi:hypothetical protein
MAFNTFIFSKMVEHVDKKSTQILTQNISLSEPMLNCSTLKLLTLLANKSSLWLFSLIKLTGTCQKYRLERSEKKLLNVISFFLNLYLLFVPKFIMLQFKCIKQL